MIDDGVLENTDVDVVFGIHVNSLLEVGHISYTPDFFIDDSQLNMGVKAFVGMTLDYMENP